MTRFRRVIQPIEGLCGNTGTSKSIPAGMTISPSHSDCVVGLCVVHYGVYSVWVPVEELERKTVPISREGNGGALFIVRRESPH